MYKPPLKMLDLGLIALTPTHAVNSTERMYGRIYDPTWESIVARKIDLQDAEILPAFLRRQAD